MPPSQKGSRKKKATEASMSTSKSNITEKKQKPKSFPEFIAHDSNAANLIGDRKKLEAFLRKHPNCIVLGQTYT